MGNFTVLDSTATTQTMKGETDASDSSIIPAKTIVDSVGLSVSHRDSINPYPVMISSGHHRVHEGTSFQTTAVDTVMADTDTLVLAFKTPSGTTRAHMIFEFDSGAGGHLDILEGATWTQGTGTLATIYNRKRMTSMTSSVLLEDQGQATFTASDALILNPTITGAGTAIDSHYAFGANKVAASGSALNEWLLKPDTQYAIRLTADGGTNAGWIGLTWYEHTDDTTT